MFLLLPIFLLRDMIPLEFSAGGGATLVSWFSSLLGGGGYLIRCRLKIEHVL